MILLVILLVVLLLFGFVVAVGAPYVPSLKKEVRIAFTELYALSEKDTVVDLGSGDGVVLEEAARRHARCYGVELNPLLVLVSRLRLGGKATVSLANMWHTPLPDTTTLVYVFSVSRDANKLCRHFQSEANRLHKSFTVMTFGPDLPSVKPIKRHRGHTLYAFHPLPQK